MTDDRIDEIRSWFLEHSWQEGLDVETFARGLKAGEYSEEFGPVGAEEITRLLRSLQGEILSNLAVKARENPALEHLQAEREEEINEKYQRLIEEYGG